MIKCDLIINSEIEHLNQIYTGFIELSKKGLIELNIIKNYYHNEPIVRVIVNNKYKLIYDTYDSGTRYARDINYEEIDYYFKRSYIKEDATLKSSKIRPLGLNYDVKSKIYNPISFKKKIINFIISKMKKRKINFYYEDFEYIPVTNENPYVCFYTRLWDVNSSEIENDFVRRERMEINKFRIECVRALKEEFKDHFIGGIEKTEYSKLICPESLLVEKSKTKREYFINLLKGKVDICVSTIGLHKSTGWKIAEYVAASRCIVSEKLIGEFPGDFKEGQNYLIFSSVDSLIEAVKKLYVDKELRNKMMYSNFQYYNLYLKPENLILNTLIQCLEEEDHE